MAFRAVSGNTTSATSSIVTKPTGTVDGDIVILIACSGTAADITFPAGFTELTPIQITTASYNAQFEVAWKIASSEGANYTIGGTGTKISAAISFSGRNSSAVESSSSNSNSTTVASPFAMTGTSITPTTGSDVLWVGLFRFNAIGEPADGVTTPPTGYTLAGNYTVTSGRGIALAYKENVTAGATGNVTASGVAGTFDDRSAVTGAYLISLAVGDVAPTITVHPANASYYATDTVTFTSDASGTPTPNLKWQVNTGSSWADISGATSNTYTTGGLEKSANGYQYRMQANNSAGTANSNAAVITFIQSGMKMFANGDVKITRLVEIANAANKLYANGTYVTSQFIEVSS